jgi:hypothetical protein
MNVAAPRSNHDLAVKLAILVTTPIMGAALLLAGCSASSTSAPAASSSATSASSSAASAVATPAAAPATTADPQILLTQAYTMTVTRNASNMSADYVAMGTDCTNATSAACRADAVNASTHVQTFLNDLGKLIVPTALTGADSLLHQALSASMAGLSWRLKGIDDGSAQEISAGSSLMTHGKALLGQAMSDINLLAAGG